ncbi:MAG: hypothetical protein R2856_07780 [Caldilineaceae bacterium]
MKDSHDRYANMEISYLLQRMELYDGITILATNLRANMDEAFTRRMQFIVDFPSPTWRNACTSGARSSPPSCPKQGDRPDAAGYCSNWFMAISATSRLPPPSCRG